MCQYFKQNVAAAKYGGAMDAETIQKNGAILKSHTSRKNFYKAFIRGVSIAIILFTVSCGNNEDNTPLDTPTGLSTKVVENGILVSWNEVKGADRYILQHSYQDFNYPGTPFYVENN